MTALERLADLRKQLAHVEQLAASRTVTVAELRRDLSLHNDVMFGLLVICQGVIDVAAEIASREGLRFQDYTEAVRALVTVEEFSEELVDDLEPLPGFRNIVIHEYTEVDLEQVVRALERLAAVHEFVRCATSAIERHAD